MYRHEKYLLNELAVFGINLYHTQQIVKPDTRGQYEAYIATTDKLSKSVDTPDIEVVNTMLQYINDFKIDIDLVKNRLDFDEEGWTNNVVLTNDAVDRWNRAVSNAKLQYEYFNTLGKVKAFHKLYRLGERTHLLDSMRS